MSPTRADRRRLLAVAERLISAPSPTGRAGAAADALAEILSREGFRVERVEAGHPASPAVAVRLESGRPGTVLQFDGHLDTVHLEFVPFAVRDGRIVGSGASDMKGGLSAAVEALLMLRDSGAPASGSVLLTAHDLHEAPWGFCAQLDRMIVEGLVGDAVMIPEPLCDHLPIAGRGQACWAATIRREGPPVHEVMRPDEEPNVLAAGADLLTRLMRLDDRLSREVHQVAGRSSAFVGVIRGGEIYNGYPQSCLLEGTRRWVPGADRIAVEEEFRGLVDDLARSTGTTIDLSYQLVRDAFALDLDHPVVEAFQGAVEVISGQRLPTGPKPFVDDGNSFSALANIPAITHGARAGGQHTTDEWALIDDLVRVAETYALAATVFCGGPDLA